MSDDFITGLRGDLVDAVDRYQRRGRVHRTRHLLPRIWRPAVAGATIAVAAVAVLLAAGSLAPAPAVRPEIVQRVHIGGQPQDAVLAGGSLWVTDFGGRVIRVDPASGRVLARIAVGGHPQAIAAGGDAVWVTSPGASGDTARSLLTRIDPATGRVADRFGVSGYVDAIAVGDGGLWLVDKRGGALERIDPASHERTARVAFPRAATLAIGGGTVWAIGDEGSLVAIDAGAPGARLRGIAVGHGPAENTLAADGDGVWVAGRGDGTVVRVQAGRLVSRIAVAGALGPIAAGDGSVWVVTGDPEIPGRRYGLAHVDPAEEKLTATLAAGSEQPKALVADGRDAWVIAADGTAMRVRAE